MRLLSDGDVESFRTASDLNRQLLCLVAAEVDGVGPATAPDPDPAAEPEPEEESP